MTLKKLSIAATALSILASPVLAQGASVLNVNGQNCRYAVPFNLDKSNLGGPVRSELREIIKKHPGATARAVGHTDATASNAYNKALSKRRVDAVVAFLQSNGAQDWNISKEWLGETHLAVQTTGPELSNRRVEIIIGECAALPPASSSPLTTGAGGLTAGTAVAGAVVGAIVLGVVINDSATGTTTATTTTTTSTTTN